MEIMFADILTDFQDWFEAAFLEQEVIGRHVPRIIVAVSKLDTIPFEQRARVLQNVSARIAKVAANIPVVATCAIEESSADTTALSALATQIESLVDRGERRIWRSRQVSQQLGDWLGQLIEIAEGAMLSMQMNAQEQQLYVKQAQNQLEKADIDWKNLKLELDRRRLKRAEEIRKRISTIQAELLENLEFEIKKITDLKEWWERDLPFRLRRELIIISRNTENLLLKFLAEDIDWVQQHLKTLFATNIKQQSATPQSNLAIPLALSDREMTDVQKYRLLTRLGSTAAMIGGSILGGPIGMAASSGILIFSEQYLDRKLDKQREILVEDLRHIIDISIDRYSQEATERLREMYQNIIDDIGNERTAWMFAKKAGISIDRSDSSSPEQWQQIIDRSLNLKQEITSALSI